MKACCHKKSTPVDIDFAKAMFTCRVCGSTWKMHVHDTEACRICKRVAPTVALKWPIMKAAAKRLGIKCIKIKVKP
jgi:hypothetical protein